MQLLVDSGVLNDLPSIVVKKKKRIRKELKQCEEKLTGGRSMFCFTLLVGMLTCILSGLYVVARLAVSGARAAVVDTEKEINKKNAELRKITKALKKLQRQRDRRIQEANQQETNLQELEAVVTRTREAMSQKRAKLDCLARQLEMPIGGCTEGST